MNVGQLKLSISTLQLLIEVSKLLVCRVELAVGRREFVVANHQDRERFLQFAAHARQLVLQLPNPVSLFFGKELRGLVLMLLKLDKEEVRPFERNNAKL